MTTIRELLEQEPKRIDLGIEGICNHGFSHIPEINDEEIVLFYHTDGFAPDIKVQVFYENLWDHRRFQRLSGVKFQDQWVMLCYNAGREGSDYSNREVFNKDAYKNMVIYLKKEIANKVFIEVTDVVDIEHEVGFVFYHKNDVSKPYFRY